LDGKTNNDENKENTGQIKNSNKFRNFMKYNVTKFWIFFSYNAIIGEIINNKNRLINNDNLDQINLKNKTK
jgi:hypothetical protein